MSEIGNHVEMVTNFTGIEDVAHHFRPTTEVRENRFEMVIGPLEREVWVDHSTSRPSYQRKHPRDLHIAFDTFRKDVSRNESMVEEEVGIVVSCIMSQDRIRQGDYHWSDVVLAAWDWDGEGLVLEAAPQIWVTPEAKVLRRRLIGASIAYQVRCTDRLRPLPFSFYPVDSVDRFGVWPQPEAWVRFGRMQAVSSVLRVAVGIERESYYLAMSVDLPTLTNFVLELAHTAEGNPTRLDAVPYWREVLVDAVAILVNSDRDLPQAVAGDAWADAVDQARAVAADMLAEDDW